MKTDKLNLLYLALLFFSFPLFSFADWELEVDWPASPAGAELETGNTIAELIQYLFEWGVAIGVVLTFGALVFAGFRYLISSGNEQKISQAKESIRSAFMGLLLLLGSWLLITIINPELLKMTDISAFSVDYPGERMIDEYKTEKEMCDYGMVSFTIRGEDPLYHTFVEEGEIKNFHSEPRSSVACRSRSGFGNDKIESGGNEYIRFVEARPAAYDDLQEPVCEISCAQDDGAECNEEIEIPVEDSEPDYCFDLRPPEMIEGFGWGGGSYPVIAWKYVAQKPEDVMGREMTCLPGDVYLSEGGGCSLNFYESTQAGRCGKKIAPSRATERDIDVVGSDREINCFEIIRHRPPIPKIRGLN